MTDSWPLGYETGGCTIAAALSVVGEKWTFLVLREAFNGIRRFDDMRSRTGMPQVSVGPRHVRV